MNSVGRLIKTNKWILLIILLLGFFVLSGCSISASSGGDEALASDTTLSGRIQLSGSTSVQPLAEELAFVFMEKNQDVKINVQGGGSGAGIQSVVDEVADMGMSSRELKNEELEEGLEAIAIAKEGILIVVNKNNPISDLNREAINGIFTGKYTNWQEIGGSNANIVVINREDGSGTRDAFEHLIFDDNDEFLKNTIIQNSTGALRTSVASDINAIGYISMGSMSDDVKALNVDGAEPTVENIQNESYYLARNFYFLTKGESNALDQAFIDWILSDDGQAIAKQEKFVPIK